MRQRLGSLFSPAMFVALLALMISLSSASVAAVMIHGKQIKKNTVTSAQIKNKTIKTKDVSPKARRQLKGQAGADGADGADGQQGAPGAMGPSNAYTNSVTGYSAMTGTLKTVMTLGPLPAGSYVVNSKAMAVAKNPNSYVFCELGAPGVTDTTGEDMARNEDYGSLANQIVFNSSTSVTVTLMCKGTAPTPTVPTTQAAHVQHKRITAIKVGSIS